MFIQYFYYIYMCMTVHNLVTIYIVEISEYLPIT